MKTSKFIARALGLIGIVFVLIALLSGGSVYDRMMGMMSDPGYLMQVGIMSLSFGVAIVAGHNVWDSSWRVVITIIGYLALLKGVVILAWPNLIVEMSQGMLESGIMPFHMAFAAAFYGWLTWLGFRSEKRESEGVVSNGQEPSITEAESAE